MKRKKKDREETRKAQGRKKGGGMERKERKARKIGR